MSTKRRGRARGGAEAGVAPLRRKLTGRLVCYQGDPEREAGRRVGLVREDRGKWLTVQKLGGPKMASSVATQSARYRGPRRRVPVSRVAQGEVERPDVDARGVGGAYLRRRQQPRVTP